MAAFNLEPVCARYGMDLVTLYKDEKTGLDDRENIVTKALDVLVENGVYAMTVFLLTCNKKEFGMHVLTRLISLLTDDKVHLISKKDVPPGAGRESMLARLTAMRRLTEDMETLFMARRVLEGALTFARYHCKALSRLKKEEGK